MPKRTPLYTEHVALGAKIVDFAGYEMPVQYSGIMQEHRTVRNAVGIFDVSHMGEFIVKGQGREEFLQNVTINNVAGLDVGQAQYSAMCYEDGGIVDDLLVYRYDDHYMLVVNAANIEKDWDWLQQHKPDDVDMHNASDEIALLAVQGPHSMAVLKAVSQEDLGAIDYYHFIEGKIDGAPMTISRTGYTGELGFELYTDNKYAAQVWRVILEAGQDYGILPVGLAARDTLRLEMKFCLYGNDIDETTNPLDAGLGWITRLKKDHFIGKEALVRIKEKGVERKLIGFRMEGRALPRPGYEIVHNNKPVGKVTSGTQSPTLGVGIGLGYVPKDLSHIGSKLYIRVRKNLEPAQIVETPFYDAGT